jgi:hypothetical protein
MKEYSFPSHYHLPLLYGANAQSDYSYVQQGEFGITAGVAHYFFFGDLNTRGINRPKPAVGGGILPENNSTITLHCGLVLIMPN